MSVSGFVLSLAAITAGGLTTGSLVFTQFALNPSVREIDAQAYVRYHQAISRHADPFMPRLVAFTTLCGVAMLAVAIAAGDPILVALATVGALTMGAVAPLTIALNVPINNRILGWSADAPPADWAAVRDRWNRYHVWRTVCALVGLVAYGATALALLR